MNPRNFFAELKRRNVYKVAVAYVVIAWLLIQAGSILLSDETSAPPVQDKSIAVLPMVNQSGDPSQEYFSDGLSEELINRLGQIPRFVAFCQKVGLPVSH